MSVLKSLAIALLLIGPVADVLAPRLYAQTSTPSTSTAKPKTVKAKKKTPVRRNPPPPPGTTGNGDFSVPVPDEDSWYSEDGVVAAAGYTPPARNQAGVLAVVNYFGAGAGVEYLRSYMPKLNLGVSFLHTSSNLEDDSTDGAKEFVEASSNSLRVYARYSMFPFLYGSAGLNFDRIAGQYGWKGSAINGERIKTDFNTLIYALDVAVGSEWKGPWSTYFGVDWFGIAVPIGGTINYDANPDVELTSKALKDKTPNQRLDEEISAQLRFYYLNLRIGMVF